MTAFLRCQIPHPYSRPQLQRFPACPSAMTEPFPSKSIPFALGQPKGRKISPNFLNHQRCKSQNQSHHAFMLHKVRISSSLWRATRPILLQFNLYLTALANFCIFSYTLACVFESLRNSLSLLHYPRFFILALASNWNCRGFFAGSEPCTILFAYSARLLSQRQEAIAKH